MDFQPLDPVTQEKLDGSRELLSSRFQQGGEVFQASGTMQEKCEALQIVFDSGDPSRDLELLSACGVVFGDAILKAWPGEWVLPLHGVEGDEPLLAMTGTSVLVNPISMIVKRVEASEAIDAFDLLSLTLERLRSLHEGGSATPSHFAS